MYIESKFFNLLEMGDLEYILKAVIFEQQQSYGLKASLLGNENEFERRNILKNKNEEIQEPTQFP